MSFYVIVDAATSRNLDPGANTNVEVMIYADAVLPVFKQRESLLEFARAQHSAQDPFRPTPLEVDPLRLVAMVQDLQATTGLRSLVFDPVIGSLGEWILPEDPWSVSAYCRYMVELARITKRLFAEGRAKLGDEFSSPEELNKAVAVWVALQADKVNADARARMQEWEIEDGSWDENSDIPT